MSASMSPERYFRQYIFLRKREDFTDEQFRVYWADKHAPLIRSLECFKKNVVRYEMIFCPSRQDKVSTLAFATAGEPLADFQNWSSIAVLDYKTEQAYYDTVRSEEWLSRAAADNKNFLDDTKTSRVLTYVDVFP